MVRAVVRMEKKDQFRKHLGNMKLDVRHRERMH